MQPRVSYGGLHLFLLHNLATRFVTVFFVHFHAFPLAWPLVVSCLICEAISCVCLWAFPMQFYVDTVKQMAVCQLVSGSPLRTLCLLIAGQPADVFSADTTSDSSIYGAVNMSSQPSQVLRIWNIVFCLEDNVKVLQIYASALIDSV